MGVWSCRTAFNCTHACPREIQVTRAIGEVKKAVATGRLDVTLPERGRSAWT